LGQQCPELFIPQPSAVAKDHGPGCRVPQRDIGEIGPGQLPGAFGHLQQDGIQVQRGADTLREARRDLDSVPLPRRLLEKLRILDSNRRLRREEPQNVLVFSGERPVRDLDVAEGDDAEESALTQQRFREHGGVGRMFQKPRRRIWGGAEVVDDDPFPPLRDRPGHPLPQAKPHGRKVLRVAVPHAGFQRLRRVVPEVQHAGAHPHQFHRSPMDEVK